MRLLLDLALRLREELPARFPGTSVATRPYEYDSTDEYVFRYSPPGILTGDVWVCVVVNRHTVDVSVEDSTLGETICQDRRATQKCERTFYDRYWIEWAPPHALNQEVSVEEAVVKVAEDLRILSGLLGEISDDLFPLRDFGRSEHKQRYLIAKMIQTTSCEKFLHFVSLMNTHRSYTNATIWAVARMKGGEILRVMENRRIALEII